MASEREKQGMSELLNLMPTQDLFSLSQTVTKRLLQPVDREEAVRVVLQHGGAPLDLLKRKKMTTEVLFKYLDWRGVGTSATRTVTKTSLVRQVLELWGGSSSCGGQLAALEGMEEEEEDSLPPPPPAPSRNASHTSLCSLDLSRDSHSFSSYLPSSQSINNSCSSYQQQQQQLTFSNRFPAATGAAGQLQQQLTFSNRFPAATGAAGQQQQQLSFSPQLSSAGTTLAAAGHQQLSFSPQLSSAVTTQCLSFQPNSTPQPHLPSPLQGFQQQQQSSSHTSPTQAQCQEMADTFVRWYYELLNSLLQQADNTEFGTGHFWPDASAKVEMFSNGLVVETCEVNDSAEDTVNMLKDVVRRHNLFHNPNTCQEGVKGWLNPHGLVVVLACGTLHTRGTVCGLFEQIFGLVRDPGAGNNWKIKNTRSRLLAKESVTELPSLANSSLAPLCYS